MSIDETIINYIKDIIKPQIKIDDEVQPVEVVYATQERWKTIQKDGFLRDARTDKAQTPIIVIKRNSVSRSTLNNPNNKYIYRSFDTPWNSRNAYDRFAVLNGIKPSSKLSQIIVPDYIKLNYEVMLWTEHQEQLNQLIEQINVENDEYWGVRNHYKFRVRIEDFTDGSDLPASDLRVIRANFNMTVEAYLIPERVSLNFKPTSVNQQIYTQKKVVAFIETTGSI
jgi:hypothetical protein